MNEKRIVKQIPAHETKSQIEKSIWNAKAKIVSASKRNANGTGKSASSFPQKTSAGSVGKSCKSSRDPRSRSPAKLSDASGTTIDDKSSALTSIVNGTTSAFKVPDKNANCVQIKSVGGIKNGIQNFGSRRTCRTSCRAIRKAAFTKPPLRRE